jgi:dephospho-CoA kinase
MTTIIGLTGGIASGKSTVSNMVKNLGVTVIDADVEARLAVEKGEPAYNQIIQHFGEEILLEDGSINRSKLGEIIFNDEKERMVLNRIVHPAVRERMEQKKAAAIRNGEKVIVLDIPLLFESKLTEMIDQIVLVYVDEDIQLKRLMERNRFSAEEALARIRSQLPLKEKKEHSDFVINNNGSIEQTKEQLDHILHILGFYQEA